MKTPKNRLYCLLAAGCVLAALPAAFANDSATKFKSMDTDGDGRISRAEHAAGARMMFDKMDTNHDGIVTQQEYLDFMSRNGSSY